MNHVEKYNSKIWASYYLKAYVNFDHTCCEMTIYVL